MDAIRIDALTAATAAWRLASRGRRPGDLATALLEAIRQREQNATSACAMHGVKTSIRSWYHDGAPIRRGGAISLARIHITLSDRAGAKSTIVADLGRTHGHVELVTLEIGLDDRTRFIRQNDRPLKLEVRQAMPETIMIALPSRVGMPLSSLVSHAVLDMPQAAGVTIAAVGGPVPISGSRVGLPGSTSDVGFDVEVDAPALAVPAAGAGARKGVRWDSGNES